MGKGRIPPVGHAALVAYIESKIERITESGCWIWMAGLHEFGYGQAQIARKHWSAPRLAWTVYKSEIPAGAWVLHRCDIPQCCNPNHLFLGTPRNNIDDMLAKQRQIRGEKSHKAKLMADVARAVRSSKEKLQVLADRHGVTIQAIWLIQHGKNWKHLGN